MKREKHLKYYLSLIGVIVLGLVFIVVFSPNRNLQMLSLAGLSFAYVLLGIVHHLVNHDLVLKIVVEYILIAGLGLAVTFFVFRGGFGF